MKKFIGIVFVLIMTMFILSSCGEYVPPTPTPTPVFEQQSAENEENVRSLIASKELPQLQNSLDFDNVKARLEYLNQKNNIGYIYLLTENGQLIREVQVMGKVTSLNTYITPMEEVKEIEDGYKSLGASVAYPGTYIVVQAPDLDGTYGENVSGIFWFTPDGVYQEWNGKYLFSAERLSFTTLPILIEIGQ